MADDLNISIDTSEADKNLNALGSATERLAQKLVILANSGSGLTNLAAQMQALASASLDGVAGALGRVAQGANDLGKAALTSTVSAISGIATSLGQVGSSAGNLGNVTTSIGGIGTASAQASSAAQTLNNSIRQIQPVNAGILANLTNGATVAANTIANLSSVWTNFQASLQSINVSGIQSAAAAFVSFTKNIADVNSEIQGFKVAMDTMVGAGYGNKLFNELTATAQKFGVSLSSSLTNFKGFEVAVKAAGGFTSDAKKTFDGFSAAISTMGLSAQAGERVFKALTQMMTKGKIQAEELTGQLGDALPGGVAIFAKALGVSEKALLDMAKAGTLVARDVLPRVGEAMSGLFAESAAARARSFNGLIQQISNSVMVLTGAFAQGSAVGFLAGFEPILRAIVDQLKRPEIENFIKLLGDISGAVIALVSGPLVLIVSALGAFAAAIGSMYGTITQVISAVYAWATSSKVLNSALSEIGTVLSTMLSPITALLGYFGNVGLAFAGAVLVAGALGLAFSALSAILVTSATAFAALAVAAVGGVTAIAGGIASLVAGTATLGGVSLTVSGLATAFTTLRVAAVAQLAIVGTSISGIVTSIGTMIAAGGALGALTAAFTGLAAGIAIGAAILGLMAGIIAFQKAVSDLTTSLGDASSKFGLFGTALGILLSPIDLVLSTLKALMLVVVDGKAAWDTFTGAFERLNSMMQRFADALGLGENATTLFKGAIIATVAGLTTYAVSLGVAAAAKLGLSGAFAVATAAARTFLLSIGPIGWAFLAVGVAFTLFSANAQTAEQKLASANLEMGKTKSVADVAAGAMKNYTERMKENAVQYNVNILAFQDYTARAEQSKIAMADLTEAHENEKNSLKGSKIEYDALTSAMQKKQQALNETSSRLKLVIQANVDHAKAVALSSGATSSSAGAINASTAANAQNTAAVNAAKAASIGMKGSLDALKNGFAELKNEQEFNALNYDKIKQAMERYGVIMTEAELNNVNLAKGLGLTGKELGAIVVGFTNATKSVEEWTKGIEKETARVAAQNENRKAMIASMDAAIQVMKDAAAVETDPAKKAAMLAEVEIRERLRGSMMAQLQTGIELQAGLTGQTQGFEAAKNVITENVQGIDGLTASKAAAAAIEKTTKDAMDKATAAMGENGKAAETASGKQSTLSSVLKTAGSSFSILADNAKTTNFKSVSDQFDKLQTSVNAVYPLLFRASEAFAKMSAATVAMGEPLNQIVQGFADLGPTVEQLDFEDFITSLNSLSEALAEVKLADFATELERSQVALSSISGLLGDFSASISGIDFESLATNLAIVATAIDPIANKKEELEGVSAALVQIAETSAQMTELAAAFTATGLAIEGISTATDLASTAFENIKSTIDSTNEALEAVPSAAQNAASGLDPLIEKLQAVIEKANEAIAKLEELNNKKGSGGGSGGDGGGNSGSQRAGGISGQAIETARTGSGTFTGGDIPHLADGITNTSSLTTQSAGGFPTILHPNEAVVPLSGGRNIPIEVVSNSASESAQSSATASTNESVSAIVSGVVKGISASSDNTASTTTAAATTTTATDTRGLRFSGSASFIDPTVNATGLDPTVNYTGTQVNLGGASKEAFDDSINYRDLTRRTETASTENTTTTTPTNRQYSGAGQDNQGSDTNATTEDQGSTSGNKIVINMTINTPDANSFKKSQPQLMSEMHERLTTYYRRSR